MLKKILISTFVIASLSLFYVLVANAQTTIAPNAQSLISKVMSTISNNNSTSSLSNDSNNEDSNNGNEDSNNGNENTQSNNGESNTGSFMSASTIAMINSCIAKGDKVIYGGNATGSNAGPVCINHFQRPAQLTITPSGRFLSRGMVIKSISSSTNSFIGEVWGTTWTIYSLGTKYFILSNGAERNTSNIISQLRVGEEVGVSGFVNKSNPGVVKARVVRNYNLNSERYQEREKEFESEGNHIRNRIERRVQSERESHGNSELRNNNSSMGMQGSRGAKIEDRRSRVATQIQDILKQIEAIKAQIQAQKQTQ